MKIGFKLKKSVKLPLSDWLFLIIFALSLLLNIVYLVMLKDKIYWPDEQWYINNAKSIIDEVKFDPRSSRLPGYPFFLGLWMIFGRSFFWLRSSGIFLGLVSSFLAYKIAFELYKNKTIAKISAILILMYPFFVYMRGFLISENMIITFILLYALCIIYAIKNPVWTNWLIAGFVSGLSVLVRPALLFSPLVVPIIILRSGNISYKKIFTFFLIFLLFFSSVIVCWVIRNYLNSGEIYLSSRGNCEIYKGMATDPGKIITTFKTPNNSEECKNAFIEELKNNFMRVLYRKLYYAVIFWSPKFDHVTGQNKDRLFLLISFIVLPLIYILAIYGWNKSIKEFRFSLTSILYIYWLFHVIVVVKFRYRIPIDSLLLIFASSAFGKFFEAIFYKTNNRKT